MKSGTGLIKCWCNFLTVTGHRKVIIMYLYEFEFQFSASSLMRLRRAREEERKPSTHGTLELTSKETLY